MKPTIFKGISDGGRRCEALRRLGEQAMAEPTRIWEELQSRGIDVTLGVIYQAISHYNVQPKTPDEGQGAEGMVDQGKGISLRDVERILSIAGKAGGVRQLVRLLRTVEQVRR